jgi:hypothetical protein
MDMMFASATDGVARTPVRDTNQASNQAAYSMWSCQRTNAVLVILMEFCISLGNLLR